MSTSSVSVTECSNCQKRFRVEAQHVGRKASCPACKTTFVVALVAANSPRGEPEPTGKVEYVGINCKSCQTRYYGTPRQVGQTLACPDCGTPNLLHRQIGRDAPKRPAALDGEQYELWEGEEQPWGVALAESHVPQARALCEYCESIQYVDPSLIGSTVTCIDCGKDIPVRPPNTQVSTGPRPVKEGDEYELDDTWSGSLEPSTVMPIYVELHNSISDEEKERRIQLAATNRRARPAIPSQPLLSGYTSFLTGPGVAIRWFTLSIFSAVSIGLLLLAASVAFDGLATIAALFLVISSFGTGVLVFAAAACCALAIVTESSEGNAYVYEWPSTNPPDWIMETLVVVFALGAGGIPGAGLAYLGQAPPLIGMAMLAASLWLFFPIALLSTLEGSSAFALLMPGVLGSLVRRGPWWLQFYLLSGGLMAVTAGIVAAAFLYSPYALMLLTPLLWVGVAVYFRLLGRLAWRIREE